MAYVQRCYINYTTDDNGVLVAYGIEDYSSPLSYWIGYFYQMLGGVNK